MISLSRSVIGYDTECTGLNPKIDSPFGFSLAGGELLYHDVRQEPNKREWLKDFFSRYKGIIVMHNASFDVRMTDKWGINLLRNNIDDTVIRAYCIDEHLFDYSLDALAFKYLGKNKETDLYQKLADLFGGLATRSAQMKNLHLAPPELVSSYAKTDAALTLELWEWQEKEIKRQGIEDIVEFERGLTSTFIRSERRGIKVDENAAEQAMDKMTPIIDRKQKQLNRLAGKEINTNSPPQVKALFNITERNGEWYTESGVLLPKTPKGGASLGSEILREMPDKEASLITQIRSDLKTRDTFLKKHILEHAYGGRVYPSIHQTKGERGGAGTGRVQYSNPAMGQIPNRDKETAAIVKPCFLPDEGTVWVDTDLHQFEVNVFLHLMNDPNITAKRQANPTDDSHEMVAQLSGLPRNASYPGEPNAKQLNLSMIFNSGDGATADKMGMPWAWAEYTAADGKTVRYKKPGPEAVAVIQQYHAKMPGVKELQAKAKRIAINRGYLRTLTGRRLRFPRGHKAYAASGLLIQATAADLNKQNWKMIEEELDGVGHMILNTHDSYGMCLPKEWEPHYKRVKARIEEEGRIRVPLILELSGAGSNWWEAIKK